MITVRWQTLGLSPKTKEFQLPDHAYNIHTELGGWYSSRDIYLWWQEYGNDKCKKLVSTRWYGNLERIKLEIIKEVHNEKSV